MKSMENFDLDLSEDSPAAEHLGSCRNFNQVEITSSAEFETPTLKSICEVLLAISDKHFRSRYRTDAAGFPDVYILSESTESLINMEVLALCKKNQTNYIMSNPEFEALITKYTRTREKPNPYMMRMRNGDTAVDLTMKIERILSNCTQIQILGVKHEARILNLIWNLHLQEQADFDDMIGIPMIFDYHEVRGEGHFIKPGTKLTEFDIYGMPVVENYKSLRTPKPSISYLTREKLGPSINYIIDLVKSIPGHERALPFSTAFKLFDQLICRLLQLHKLRIVHGDLDPCNLNFGRMNCSNVLYINDFSKATALPTSPCAVKPLHGSLRVASLAVVRGAQRHPYQDLESAFYVLLAMLLPFLPWDPVVLETGNKSETLKQRSIFSDENTNARNETESMRFSRFSLSTSGGGEEIQKCLKNAIIEKKSALWNGQILFKKIDSMLCRLNGRTSMDKSTDDNLLSRHAVQEVYARIRDIVNVKKPITTETALTHCKNLVCTGGEEYQLYLEIRRCTLIFFKFDALFPSISTVTYQKKRELYDALIKTPWDLSSWCFSSLKMRSSRIAQGKDSAGSRE